MSWLSASLLALAAPPPIQSIGVRDLVEATTLSGLSSSPDGSVLLVRAARPVLSANAVALQWTALDPQTGAVRWRAGGGRAIFDDPGLLRNEQPLWSRDGRRVYLRVLGDDGVQLACLDAATGARMWTTREPGDVESVALANGGSRIKMVIGPDRQAIDAAEREEYAQGIFVDATVDMAQPLFRGGYVNGRKATQRFKDSWFGRAGLLDHLPRRARAVDEVDGRSEPWSGDADGSSGAGRGAEPSARVVDVDDEAYVELMDGRGGVNRCTHRLCRAARPQWAMRALGGDVVAALRGADDRTMLIAWQPQSGTARRLVESDDRLDGGGEGQPCQPIGENLFCVAAGPSFPPAIIRIDLRSGRRAIVHDPNHRLRAYKIDVERISWLARSGRRFHGLFYPARAGGRPGPLVIAYYRCRGWLPGGFGDEWPFALLAQQGIASLCIDKGSYEGDPVASYAAAQDAIETIVPLLRAGGRINHQPIGMAGLSFGSEVALWVARNTDLVGAVSIASVQVESSYWWFNAVRGRAQPEMLFKTYGLGSPDETPERWRTLSPARDVARIRAPVLIQVPEQEARTMMELYARLTRSRTPAEMHVYPDEPHVKTQPAHRASAYQRNIDWFTFWLNGRVDPVRHSDPQYARWRALATRADQAGDGRPSEDSQSSTPRN